MERELGPGRILIAVYGIFAISASARALYQLIFEFEQAPIAYSLSALAAFVYVVATLLMANSKLRKYAIYAIVFELIGVMAVGLLSAVLPELFNHPSVWSGFGIGYGFIPLLLPLLGIYWLRRVSV
ncbi:MAG: hypothetical protein ACO3BY_02350 [Aquiluna sp.]